MHAEKKDALHTMVRMWTSGDISHAFPSYPQKQSSVPKKTKEMTILGGG